MPVPGYTGTSIPYRPEGGLGSSNYFGAQFRQHFGCPPSALFFLFDKPAAGGYNGLTEKAVPVIVIGVPVRYAHTHYGISAYADFDNAVKLACEILKRLDEEQIMSF